MATAVQIPSPSAATPLSSSCADEKHRPGGDGDKHTNGRDGGVHHIGQHLAGSFKLVGDIAHGRAHGHGVEVVIHKQNKPHHPGNEQRPG